MNKKVVFGLLGLAGAAGLAYYFWQKNNSSQPVTSAVNNNPNVNASGGFIAALQQNTTPAVTPCKYPEGQLLKAGGAKVYYVDGACTKHWVPGNIYSKYGFKGGDIKAISQAEMDAIPEGDTLQGLSGGYLMWE